MNAKPLAENLRDANEAGVNLLLSDSQIALTLLDAAEATSNVETRARRIGEARKAYDTIHHLRRQLTLDEAQSNTLDEQMSTLRKRLIRAGAFGE
jgi:hypothetical protein